MKKIITIDGPAGAGKSTVARKLAEVLDVFYLDTGAMYRALTYKALQAGVSLDNEDELARLAAETMVDLEDHSDGIKVLLDGKDVSQEIRRPEVTNKTFYVARAPRVRAMMVKRQREIGERQGCVVEGRDVGTVVFPQATNKFYLDADVHERTKRRFKELKKSGVETNEAQLLKEVMERDEKDKTRSVGPLKKADDAVFIDSTQMSVDDVVALMLKQIHKNG